MLLLSKFLNLLAQPLNAVALLLVLALLRGRRAKWAGQRLTLGALLLLLLIGLQTLPDALLGPLEDQSPAIALDADLSGYAGVIVLGGALEPGRLSALHAQPLLNGSAERMTTAVTLVQRNPGLRLVFSGGEGELFGSGPSEATRAALFFASLGIPATALTLETRSRSTFENAVYTHALPSIDTQQRWLLLTSAWHMPRALGTFRKAGWNVTPFPVDYRTAGTTPLTTYNLADGAERWELLLHELIGMASYRLLGRM